MTLRRHSQLPSRRGEAVQQPQFRQAVSLSRLLLGNNSETGALAANTGEIGIMKTALLSPSGTAFAIEYTQRGNEYDTQVNGQLRRIQLLSEEDSALTLL